MHTQPSIITAKTHCCVLVPLMIDVNEIHNSHLHKPVGAQTLRRTGL